MFEEIVTALGVLNSWSGDRALIFIPDYDEPETAEGEVRNGYNNGNVLEFSGCPEQVLAWALSCGLNNGRLSTDPTALGGTLWHVDLNPGDDEDPGDPADGEVG